MKTILTLAVIAALGSTANAAGSGKDPRPRGVGEGEARKALEETTRALKGGTNADAQGSLGNVGMRLAQEKMTPDARQVISQRAQKDAFFSEAVSATLADGAALKDQRIMILEALARDGVLDTNVNVGPGKTDLDNALAALTAVQSLDFQMSRFSDITRPALEHLITETARGIQSGLKPHEAFAKANESLPSKKIRALTAKQIEQFRELCKKGRA